MSHHVNRVWFTLRAVFQRWCLTNCRHHRVGDFVVRLGPSIDNLVVLFTLSDQAVHVLLFEVFHLLTGLVDKIPLRFRDDHVVLTEGNASLERFAEAHCHDLVTEDDGLFLTAVTVDRVDDLLHFFLTQKTVHKWERRFCVQRQQRTKAQAAWSGFEPLHHLKAFLVDLRDTGCDFGVQMHFAGVQGVLNFFDVGEGHAFALHAFTLDGRVVKTKDHVLGWHDDRRTVGR